MGLEGIDVDVAGVATMGVNGGAMTSNSATPFNH